MEDEDNENGLVDKWTLWEEAYYKEAGVDTLAQINNSNVSLDDIDETREDCFYSSYPQESRGNGDSDVNLKNVIKGFKKNILKTQPEENQVNSLNDNVSAEQPPQTNDTAKEKTNEMVEVKENNMAEYAQYLGLQPASSKSECSQCSTLTSKQRECDCSATEESSQVDADSSKLSLVNNAELPSTSSSCKLPCTENSQSSSLGNSESMIINNLGPLCNNNTKLHHTDDTQNRHKHCSAKTCTNKLLFTDDAELLPDKDCNSQLADATRSSSPEEKQSVLASQPMSSSADGPKSPDADISEFAPEEAPQSPSTEQSQSPQPEISNLSPAEASQSPTPQAVHSPTPETVEPSAMETSQSPTPETDEPSAMETCQSPAPETVKSPSSDTKVESPLADGPSSLPEETFQSPAMGALNSPQADNDVPISLAEEASQSPAADACMSPASESTNSQFDDVSQTLPEDAFDMSPSSDGSQSPISNDVDLFSISSPKAQHVGSESTASSCSQSRPKNFSESASCDSSELPPAESPQSPPQINLELSCDSNSKELQTDSSEVATEKYEPIPSTSGEQHIQTPSTSRSSSAKSLDSNNTNSGAASTSQPSNFKITSKVYLCAACETYFENWNLFTHMREVHQRHICLFCLGMFGQAERLSHHLLKKHNVPDMNFNSAEEFFKVFIGPCYVVCCDCDKMFSETDNFYNHFCPPKEAVQSTSGVCSQCKKINSHADGCRLAPEKSDSKAVSRSLPSSSRTTEPAKTNQTVTNVIRHSKRTIKPNRFNDDIYLYTKLTNIRTKRTKLQSTSETSDSACSDTHRNTCAAESREVTGNSFSDTPMEGICAGAESRSIFENNRSAWENHSHESESESLSRVSAKDTYDSVTETIMAVSQGTNFNDSVHMDQISSGRLERTLDCSTSKGTVESSDPKDEDDVRLQEKNVTSDETKEHSLEHNTLNDADENHNSDSESQASNSSSDAADEFYNDDYKVPTRTKKEQNKPVLSATPVTDRSLVIKICTKNNSVYSIKTPSHLENSIENHDSSRESEENNNSEESDKAPAAEEPLKNVQDNNPDEEKMDVTENCENDLGSINFDSDVNKENKSDIDNQLDKKNEENSTTEDKPIVDAAESKIETFDGIPLAGEEIPIVDLEVDDLLENMELEELLKRCIKAVCGICVYCNHTRHIAVNGKQLSLHMLSEHRFQPQHPAIIINQEQFVIKVKKCFNELESYFFNLDSYNSKLGTYNISTVKNYECFHCRFYSNSHKELYLHNRKMHQKPILICIMCKSTFLSYSELLCHLCPGVYAANVDILYRCCLCEVSNIPSAFRLMVHLRKLHHACDVCLETTGNQQNLSNHVWKHKLHHLCYRCGIAYRNKPDITKHLFWKHGTESVMCKKCLQKKWPYIYHFCVPPADFHCEECGFICSKAVALKVHKRIHANEYPYSCSECPEKLISKKLLAKHEKSHREPEQPPPPPTPPPRPAENQTVEEDVHVDVCNTEAKENEAVQVNPEVAPKEPAPVKKVVDVLDLPPLNLSDSDSDDEEEEEKPADECKSAEEPDKIETDVVDKPEAAAPPEPEITTEPPQPPQPPQPPPASDAVVEVVRNEEEKKQEEQIMDGIWGNFKSYTASLEKQEAMEVDGDKPEDAQTKEEREHLKKVILAEHDYWVVYPNKGEDESGTSNKTTDDNVAADKAKVPVERTPSPGAASGKSSPKKKVKSPKKKKKENTSASSSDSSSDSDSSNCSCATGCSCSSSSSNSSSSSSSSSDSDSSTSDSPKKASREKRKKGKIAVAKLDEEKNEVIEEQQPRTDETTAPEVAADSQVEVVAPVEPPKPVLLVIRESDLETTESDTDEEFYDENPQKTATQLLAEKRKQTLLASGISGGALADAAASPTINGVMDTTHSSTEFAAAAASSPGDQRAEDTPSLPAGKRKFKTRKRRKGLWGKARTPAKSVESIKLNIPKASYQRRGAPRGRRHSSVSNVSAYEAHHHHQSMPTPEASSTYARTHSLGGGGGGGSGSEMDTTRSSKRRRVPKRFYDDSSDEENHMQRMLKWRRTDPPPPMLNAAPSPSSSSSSTALNQQSFQQQQQLLLQQQQQQQQLLIQQQQQLIMQQQQQQLIIQQQQQQLQFQQEQLLQAQRQQQQQQQQQRNDQGEEEEGNNLVIAATESESNNSSSSESSDSDNETTIEAKNEVPAVAAAATAAAAAASTGGGGTLFHSNFPQLHPVIPERSNNLYCYCQCPYDEVSEMIACDGDDCQIEWFHFDCVGISVPPKGKWFCPDCRKNLGVSDDEMLNG